MFSMNASVPTVGMKPNNSPLALFLADIRNISLWKSVTCQSYLLMVYLITLSVTLTTEYRTIEYLIRNELERKWPDLI